MSILKNKKLRVTLMAVALVASGFLVDGTLAVARGQRYSDFMTRTPLEPGDTLILGFLGGREKWNNQKQSVRKLALKLRAMNLDGVHVETLENMRRELAIELVRNAFDTNKDGTLDAEERSRVRLILYGQSFGGAAVAKLAHELHELEIPVLLTVQVDSVGLGDGSVPPNVAKAANLYQRDGLLIQGEPEVQAADPQKTTVLGNWRYDYKDKPIDLSDVPWYRKVFRTAHIKMEHDPDVWVKVEELILAELRHPEQQVADSPGVR